MFSNKKKQSEASTVYVVDRWQFDSKTEMPFAVS